MGLIKYRSLSKPSWEYAHLLTREGMTAGEIKNGIASRMSIARNLIDIVSLDYVFVYADDNSVNTEKIFEIMQHPAHRYVPLGMRSYLPDMTYAGMDDEPRVMMSCGHAITADNLYNYATVQLKEGQRDIKCLICSRIWSFDEIASKSQMNADEKIFWGAKISFNGTKHDELCSSDWRNRSIGKPELQRMLNTCSRKTMKYSNIGNVPSLRLCPNCGALVEHAEMCKQIPCYRCKGSFCFVCLTMCKNGCLQCSGYDSICTVAPVQTV